MNWQEQLALLVFHVGKPSSVSVCSLLHTFLRYCYKITKRVTILLPAKQKNQIRIIWLKKRMRTWHGRKNDSNRIFLCPQEGYL